MAVSLTGSRMSMASIRSIVVAITLACGLAFYFYGPTVTPVMHAAAASKCNELTGGNFRSYDLDWVIGVLPHWECSDLSDPARPAADLGWWVTPGR